MPDWFQSILLRWLGKCAAPRLSSRSGRGRHVLPAEAFDEPLGILAQSEALHVPPFPIPHKGMAAGAEAEALAELVLRAPMLPAGKALG